jgi:hypothetical protein
MIPSFVIVPGALWPLLPPGIHDASMEEVYKRYAINNLRQVLFGGFKNAVENIFTAGCPQVFLDGSYVTAKPEPGDYDALWDRRFVDPAQLDPIFLDFTHGTIHQKAKYLGEFFPASATERATRRSFMDFFQKDRLTGAQKGIIRITNYLKGGGSI